MRPFVGLYTTTYNTEDTIKPLLASLYRTFGKNFILVVVDNCSKDRTFELLKEYENVYAIQEKSTRGKGYQLAFEILVKKFEPDFIIRIDADVEFIPELMREYTLKRIEHYTDNDIWNGSLMSLETAKKILNEKLYYPNYNIFEDFLWWAKLIKKGFNFKWLMAIQPFKTEIKEHRERRYAKGFEYLKRKLGFYLATFHYLYYNLTNFKTLSFHNIRIKYGKLIFPEEIGLSDDLLAFFAPRKYFPFYLFKNRKNIVFYSVRKYIVVFGKSTDKLIKELQQNFLQWLQGKR